MSIASNRPWYERLAEGCTTRNHIDDPSFSPKQIFQNVALSFNDERINIQLPSDAYDLIGIEDIDANDPDRVRITRDCK